MAASLPKRRWLRFAIFFIAFEAFAWLVLSVWDYRHPRYQAEALILLNGYQLNRTDTDWMPYLQQAASAETANYRITPFYGDRNDLKDFNRIKSLYVQTRERFRENSHSKYARGAYRLTVTAATAEEAAIHANHVVRAAATSAQAAYDDYEQTERLRWTAASAAGWIQAQMRNDLSTGEYLGSSLAGGGAIGCGIGGPLMLLKKVALDTQPVQTFGGLWAQGFIFLSALVAGFWPQAWKFSLAAHAPTKTGQPLPTDA
jgi:hypothetical protein